MSLRTTPRRLLARISASLAEPYELGTQQWQLGASIGVVRPLAEYAADPNGVEDLLRDADIAMYEAKKTQQPWVYFDQKMRERLVERQKLEADLRGALQRREFFSGLSTHRVAR